MSYILVLRCLVSISGISISNHKLGDQSLLFFWGKNLRAPCLHRSTRELSAWSPIRRLRGLVDFGPSGPKYCSCCHQTLASPNTAGAAIMQNASGVGARWFWWHWRGKPERWGSVWHSQNSCKLLQRVLYVKLWAWLWSFHGDLMTLEKPWMCTACWGEAKAVSRFHQRMWTCVH
jgi:hypothetical protein